MGILFGIQHIASIFSRGKAPNFLSSGVDFNAVNEHAQKNSQRCHEEKGDAIDNVLDPINWHRQSPSCANNNYHNDHRLALDYRPDNT